MNHIKNIYAKTLLSAAIISASLLGANIANAMQPTSLEQAIAGEYRSDKHKARDEYRHPQQTLEFFGFKSTMTVVEISPGGGWYTEILAPALKGSGKLYGAQYPDTGKDDYYSNSRRKLEKKLSSNNIFSEVVVTDLTPKKSSEFAPKGIADLVLTFRNLHNWGATGVTQVFTDAHQALKADGILGIVEHRMPADIAWDENKDSGYMPTAMVIKLANEAGFTLAEQSEINANSKDSAMHPKGVWTLLPVLRLGEQDKAKYIAIGESDRMTLKFIKSK
jgi:predicted methyltransferase